MKTNADKLRAAAAEALKANDNNIEKAAPKFALALMDNSRRPLLIALVSDYLTSITATPRTGPTPKGRRREGAHRRGQAIGMPSEAQKAGALAAATLIAAEIFDRKIRGVGPLGNIRVHELRAIAQGQAITAGLFIQRGYDDAVEAIACVIISQHCVAADPFAKVSDVVSAKVAAGAFEDARVRAAEILANASTRVAHDLIESARGKGIESPPS